MAEEAKAKGGSKKKLLIIVIAVVALVVVGGGLGAVFLLGGGKPAEAQAEGEQKEEAAAPESVITMDSFVVNLGDPRGDRFLKATLRAVVSDKEMGERIEKDELLRSRVRDRVISVLTSKTFEEISNANGKESLRQQLVREINQALPNDIVKEVLFVEFIVQ